MHITHKHNWKVTPLIKEITPKDRSCLVCLCGAVIFVRGLKGIYSNPNKFKTVRVVKSPIGYFVEGMRKALTKENPTFDEEKRNGIADFFAGMVLFRYKLDDVAATKLLINGVFSFIGKEKLTEIIKEAQDKGFKL